MRRCLPTARSASRTGTGPAPGSRTPTRCAAPRRSPAAPATPSTTPAGSPGASSPSAVDNPVVTLDGRVESNGNFHGAPGRLRPGLPRHRRRRCRVDAERRTDRFLDVARNHGLTPVPCRRPRRRQRPHDRAVHPGRRRKRRPKRQRSNLSNPNWRPWPMRSRPARTGCTRSSSMATAPSPISRMVMCAC